MLMLALAAGLMYWGFKPAHQPHAVAAERAPGAVSATAMAASSTSPAVGVETVILPASPGKSSVTDDATSGTRAFVEVCGVGRLDRQAVEGWTPSVDGTPPPAWQRALELRKDAALNRLASRLAVGTAHEQVAARLLMRDAEGAAAIAARSTDPAAHHLGLVGCARWGAPSCAALTTQAWVRLDPGDARPWMRLMYDAVRKRDEAAAAEALEQVLARDRRSSSSPLLDAVVQASAAVDDRAGLALALIDVIGQEAAILDSGVMATERYCSADKLKDAARRGQCERWANWQFKHADSLLDADFVTGLADRLSMPAAQRRFTREEVERARGWLIEDSSNALGFDCASLSRTADWVTRRARQGELQLSLKASGSP